MELDALFEALFGPVPTDEQIPLRTLCDARGPATPGHHMHLCENCGTCWEHHNALPAMVSTRDFELSHECPKCGTRQVWKHEVLASRTKRIG